MIQFQKLKYKNFLSTGNSFTKIDFTRNKTTLVVGANGSGKSTMLDALSFALFGKSHRNINKPQLVNSINNKGMVVEVEFKVNKQKFKVVRGLKPAVFEIWKGDTLFNQNSHAKEYQKLLEQNILKLTHKSFHQVVVLGSSSFIPFMQLPSQYRRDVIEDLLDINVFSKMNQILKEKINILKASIERNKQEREIIKTKVNATNATLRDLKLIGKEDLAIKNETIEQYQHEIELGHNAVKEKREKIEELSGCFNEEQKTKSVEYLKKYNKFKAKFDSERDMVRKQVKFFSNNDNCPSCDQKISKKKKNEKISTGEERIKELENALKQANDSIDKADQQISIVNAFNDRIAKLNNDIMNDHVKIEEIEKHIINIQKNIRNHQHHESIMDAENQLDRQKKELDDSLYKYENLMELAEYNFVVSEMLKDTGFKAKIIKQYLPVMNKLVNHYLQVLDFFVHFDLNEEFKETIRSRYRDAFSYDSFSEGEKQRIDLSLLFTWRQVAKMKNSVSTNLLLLDETFDSSLDADGIENLMKILDTLDDNTNVFVISHKGDMLEGKFDSKIEFKKFKNFSKMV